MKLALMILAGVCLGVSLPGQSCSALATTGSVAPGGSFSIDLTGADADTMAWIFFGRTQGSTTLNPGPGPGFTLGLDSDFRAIPLGFTDVQGDRSRTINVPTSASLQAGTVYLQAVTMDVSYSQGQGLSIAFCVSNVASLNVSAM